MLGSATQNLGDWGERVAAWWLAKQGYKIIKQHYTTRFGEIDLIAKDNDQVVFIEVKLRLGINSGLPEQSVDFRKLKHMKKVILFYISQNVIENFRVDVIAISKGNKEKSLKIRHHKALSDMFN
ncbi:MAG: YraN family protein [Parcubacteria group bacterium CG11_big_fil_rev_8_21_14_0_20_41_14]|nr:MAG: YraN family protein [Parcubacteria group bacterium CG22_combo_CG10-13_8_21_14_all_41_9]PIQ80170.1 MAG: YraN family protein [Parcubacteria group bacterium CG11_big_fil_rev_8_21_14_0_20_41_14]PIR57148.1 MAG: YraN family protein [Parcubacteria group bacterium CG10_big_fil_rev_8_21_14_0_10_41_35]PIZ81758.1 MAG: YraN family protein [Parcubacteria group bacterium CG_4_10_14_0_2_um_filter_41_6]